MTLPYKRSFTKGRQSELLYNEDLHKIYETTRHISEIPETDEEPELKLHGALWRDDETNELKYCNKTTNRWEPVFGSKFQIIDQMLTEILPSDPVLGQLWIHNGVLYYFDGSEWIPIKAQVADDSQFSQAAFADFILVSPLLEVGHTVQDILEDSNDYYQHYYKDKMDYENRQDLLYTEEKWEPNWNNPFSDPAKNPIPEDTKTQFILPNIKYDKFFIDHTLRRDFETVSSVCLQYPTKEILGTTESAVHINGSKLTKITKRLVKVDKKNPTIEISAYNTEFYGYRNGEYTGDLLIPSDSVDTHDYIVSANSIILNYTAAQNYDYVLSVTYTFGWIRDTGSLKVLTSNDVDTGYYINNMTVPIDVFVDGLKLEDRFYQDNPENSSVEITDKNFEADKYSVDFLHSIDHEFGYIRDTTLDNYGIVKLHRNFKKPLLFVNGMAMHSSLDGLKYDDNIIYVPNAKINMPWSVIETSTNDVKTSMYMQTGIVSANAVDININNAILTEENNLSIVNAELTENEDLNIDAIRLSSATEPLIYYSGGLIKPEDGIILFLDGFLIPESEIIRDTINHTITIQGGLREGQKYILLRDPEDRLYNGLELLPAFNTGATDISMLYMNGKLLCDNTPILEINAENNIDTSNLAHGEIKFFIIDENNQNNGIMKMYDMYNKTWTQVSNSDAENIKIICGSYSQALSSVQINVPYTKDDEFVIYSFKYANRAIDVLKIGTLKQDLIDNPDGSYWIVPDNYVAGKGMLNIWCNGVKLINGIDYVEQFSGDLVRIANLDLLKDEYPVFTYIVEPLENGNSVSAQFVTLVNDDALGANVYRIPDTVDVTFYPGRLTVYRNGIRLAKEDWTLLGNKTIQINKQHYATVSNASGNYPQQSYRDEETGNVFSITHKQPDQIVVEIRQEFERKEVSFIYNNDGSSEFYTDTYGIPTTIFESKDEILIFINGLFTGLRNKAGYHIDKNKACITIDDPGVLSMLNSDPLWYILSRNDYMYTEWKIRNKKSAYESPIQNKVTLMWR